MGDRDVAGRGKAGINRVPFLCFVLGNFLFLDYKKNKQKKTKKTVNMLISIESSLVMAVCLSAVGALMPLLSPDGTVSLQGGFFPDSGNTRGTGKRSMVQSPTADKSSNSRTALSSRLSVTIPPNVNGQSLLKMLMSRLFPSKSTQGQQVNVPVSRSHHVPMSGSSKQQDSKQQQQQQVQRSRSSKPKPNNYHPDLMHTFIGSKFVKTSGH